MVIRKLLILGRSFRHWHWDTSLAVVLLLTAYLPKMRREGRLPVLDEAPAFTACLAGLLSGSIAAFLLNDSGPVVPSLAAIYGYAGLFYLNRR
jgi:CHASE2 domain-containing sensor protein